ncbi:MAG: LysR family transcriptional regulator [Anaeromyxobacteraceae bacterium]
MKAELELRHLKVFLAVVEEGTVTAAARALGTSQSTVSETLVALERALGAAVLRRAGRGPLLTAAGEALVPHARRMLALRTELLGELAKVSTAVNARLAVAAVESLCAYVLPARLAALRARWPGTRVEVMSLACAQIREAVAGGRCDVGLVLEAEERERADDEGQALARARLVIFGAPGHPLAGGPAAADALRRCDFFMSDAAGDYHDVLRRHFVAAGLPPPRTQALGTVEGVKRGILAGGEALGLLPVHAIEKELREGVYVEVAVRPALGGLVLRALTPSGAAESPVVGALLDGLRSAKLGG